MEQFNKFKVLNSKDKDNFAEGSLERRRLEVEEKINALPAPTDKDVCKNRKCPIIIICSSMNTHNERYTRYVFH